MNNPDKKKRRSEHANDVSWLSRSKKPRGELGHVDHVSQRRLQVWWACVKNRSLANLLEKLTIGQRTVREMRATVLRFAPREGQAPHTVGDVVRTFKSSTAVFDAFLVDSAFAPSSPSHHDHELYDVTLKYRLMAALEEIEADRDACAEPLDDWTAMKRVMQTRVAFPAEPPPEELKIPARADSDETSLATDQNVTATQQGVSRLLRELTEDEQAYVREMLSRIGPAHEVLASSGTNYVTRENLQTLQPRVWLNDAIINCFFHLLGVRDAELCRVDEARKRCHFFTSYFMDKLTNKDHANPDLIGTYRFANVATWSRKVEGQDIFRLDKIFFPINVGKCHWSCAVVFMQEKRIEYYDSFGGNGIKYLYHLIRYIRDEYSRKHKAHYSTDDWHLIPCQRTTPAQHNGYDCGVFVCMYADLLSVGNPLVLGQDEADRCREMIALSILQQTALGTLSASI